MESKQLITQDQAREKATALVQKYQSENAMVFVQPEDLRTQKVFLPEVVLVRATPEDCHNISGKLMPKGYVVDRIGEASGITFVPGGCDTRKEGDCTWVGLAQGKKRLPDGTWRFSSVQSYEFDTEVRATEDFANDTKGKYNTIVAKEKHKIELKKFARQRASTGARLRVIRELTGMPTAFKPQDAQRAMVFSRVAINTDQLLADPATRQAAINQAIGVTGELFAQPAARDVTPEKVALPEPEANGQEPPVATATAKTDDDPFDEKDDPEKDLITEARLALEDWMNSGQLKPSAESLVREALANKNATLVSLQDLIKRCKDFTERKTAKQQGVVS